MPSAGLIIGINNENERVAIPLSPYTPYQLVSLVKNERVQQELYFAQPNITTEAIKAWHIPNQGWLVNRIQNNLTGILVNNENYYQNAKAIHQFVWHCLQPSRE